MTHAPQTFAYADTSVSDYYATTTVLLFNKTISPYPVKISLPNGQPFTSTNVGNMQLNVPPEAQIAHIVPGLQHNLVSIAKLCDTADSGAWFGKTKVTVCKRKHGQELIQGPRDHAKKIWKLDIGNTLQCNSVHQMKGVKFMYRFMYEALFCPALFTLQHAIKNNFLSGFPYINDRIKQAKCPAYQVWGINTFLYATYMT